MLQMKTKPRNSETCAAISKASIECFEKHNTGRCFKSYISQEICFPKPCFPCLFISLSEKDDTQTVTVMHGVKSSDLEVLV